MVLKYLAGHLYFCAVTKEYQNMLNVWRDLFYSGFENKGRGFHIRIMKHLITNLCEYGDVLSEYLLSGS